MDIHPATYELKHVDWSEVIIGWLYYPEKQVMDYLFQCDAVYVVLVGVIFVKDTNIYGDAIFLQKNMLRLILLQKILTTNQ